MEASTSSESFPSLEETSALASEKSRVEYERKNYPAAQMLAKFLKNPAQTEKITGRNDSRTNIIDQSYCVTYALPLDSVNNLFTHLEEVRLAGLIAHFSEKQGTPESPNTGLMIDYDLYVTNPHTKLEDRHAHRIAHQIVNFLCHDLIFPASASKKGNEILLHVFTIVKPAPVAVFTAEGKDEKKYKYGFHVLVPGIRVSCEYKKYLFQKLHNDKQIINILSELDVFGDPEKCLDKNSASVPVLFLGSCKRGGKPYKIGPSFEVTFEANLEGSSNKSHGIYCPMIRSLNIKDLENQKYNLVAETSLCFTAKYASGNPLVPAWKCSYCQEIETEIANTSQNIVKDGELFLAEHSLSTLAVHDPDAHYIHQLLDLLDDSYYTDRNKWRDVIFILANTSKYYKPLAEWFSHKCPTKWADGGRDHLDKIWDDAIEKRGNVKYPLTKRSLIRWAQDCDPKRFRQISEKNYYTILSNYAYGYVGGLEHYMFAKILYSMLGNKFVVDIDEGNRGRYTYCWFEFVVPGQKHCPGEVWKWRKEIEPDEIHKYVSENLPKVLDQFDIHIEEERNKAENEGLAKFYTTLKKSFLKTRCKIFNDTFKNGIIRQANYLFRKRDFVKSLDSDPLLLGTGNGVLHLGPVCTLIDHFHEYPIMKFTPVSFRPFDPDNYWTKLLLQAIADIIPEDDFRNWLLFFAASSLAGGVKEGILLLWKGGGANGKTFFMRMIAKTLGHSYAKKLSIALLTSERESADKPNSALMQLKGCRFSYVEETQKAELLNSQRLKEIVNPGEISGRETYKSQETFEVTANLMVGQNYDFLIDTTDHGTWRRLKHYKSKVKFCNSPDSKNKYEKKEDQRFVREYINNPACQEAMLGILTHYYQRLQTEYDGFIKNVPCSTLDYETEIFRNSQDTINSFITETIVYSPNTKNQYPLTDISANYIEWHTKNISKCNHTASEIIQNLESSALQRYITRSANKTMVLTKCRVLPPENSVLCAGETYFGTKINKQGVSPHKPHYPKQSKQWWSSSCHKKNEEPEEDEEDEELIEDEEDEEEFLALFD